MDLPLASQGLEKETAKQIWQIICQLLSLLICNVVGLLQLCCGETDFAQLTKAKPIFCTDAKFQSPGIAIIQGTYFAWDTVTAETVGASRKFQEAVAADQQSGDVLRLVRSDKTRAPGRTTGGWP
jgi:hypothetical protein